MDTQVCLLGGCKCYFSEMLSALFSCSHSFEIFPFALLQTYCSYIVWCFAILFLQRKLESSSKYLTMNLTKLSRLTSIAFDSAPPSTIPPFVTFCKYHFMSLWKTSHICFFMVLNYVSTVLSNVYRAILPKCFDVL